MLCKTQAALFYATIKPYFLGKRPVKTCCILISFYLTFSTFRRRPTPPLTVNKSRVSGDADRDCAMGEGELVYFPRPSSSRASGEGHPRFSIWSFRSPFAFCLLFFFFFSDIATPSHGDLRWWHVQEKWSAASIDDWEGTDWSRCFLLFVSLAVVCDLLGWWEHWGCGLFSGAKRRCRFCHLQKLTQRLHRANGKSANQQQLVMNATLTEPKRPTNNTSLTAADNAS